MSAEESSIVRLLREAQAGSADALGRLLETLRPYLLLVANKEMDSDLQSKAGASDLVQESCLEAQRDIGGFQGSTSAELMAWLRQIVRHNAMNFSRSYWETEKRDAAKELSIDESNYGKSLRAQLPSSEPTPYGAAIDDEQRRRLREAVARLPAHYREVIVLRHMERATFKEIADRLQTTAEAARKTWFRAVDRLRREMKVADEE